MLKTFIHTILVVSYKTPKRNFRVLGINLLKFL